MKPFNLEEALAGKPVILRNGQKAMIVHRINHKYIEDYYDCELIGFMLDEYGIFNGINSWTISGEFFKDSEYELGIVGMWEENQPRITLDLPAPLKEPREGMCFIKWGMIYKSNWVKGTPLKCLEQERLEEGRYLANEQDAQEWIDAMKNNRA